MLKLYLKALVRVCEVITAALLMCGAVALALYVIIEEIDESVLDSFSAQPYVLLTFLAGCGIFCYLQKNKRLLKRIGRKNIRSHTYFSFLWSRLKSRHNIAEILALSTLLLPVFVMAGIFNATPFLTWLLWFAVSCIAFNFVWQCVNFAVWSLLYHRYKRK